MIDRMKIEGKHKYKTKKNRREMVGKQQRNAKKKGLSKNLVLVCFGLGSFSGIYVSQILIKPIPFSSGFLCFGCVSLLFPF